MVGLEIVLAGFPSMDNELIDVREEDPLGIEEACRGTAHLGEWPSNLAFFAADFGSFHTRARQGSDSRTLTLSRR